MRESKILLSEFNGRMHIGERIDGVIAWYIPTEREKALIDIILERAEQ